MRQYRGLTKDGKWVYGDRLTINKKVYIANTDKVPCEIFYHDKPNGERVNILSSLCTAIVEVLPETVGQSIGKKDKNNKEIYDKDRLISGKRVLTVVWGNDSMQWKAQEEDSDFLTPLCQWAITEQFEIEESK